MTNRLFVSLDIPESVIEQLIKVRDEIANPKSSFRWEHESKLHITLKFLGDVGENITELMERRFEDVVFDKIKCTFNKFSFFVKNGQPRILFADFDPNNEIGKFQKIIEEECELLGFAREKRKYRPHLTLLRIKEHINISDIQKFNNHEINIEPFEIETFSIMKSELKLTGSEYTKVKSFKLL